jgi:hypothetical protein
VAAFGQPREKNEEGEIDRKA